MAFGQIDPARLEGDALRRWYLRSPEDIEDERLRRADQSYDAFYGGLQNVRQSASPTASRPRRASGFGSTGRGSTSQVAAHDATAVAPQWTWSGPRKPRATVDDCVDCHGRFPSPPQIPGMLPPFGKLPLPGGFPMFRRPSGGTPEGRRKLPQCDMQYESDSEICRKAKSRTCWENAAERLAYCTSHDGEIGSPPLQFGRPGR